MHGLHAGGLYCVESLDRRQQYKRQLLIDHYNAKISDKLASRLLYIDRQPDQTVITLRGFGGAAAGRVIDRGDRLTGGRRGSNAEILAMIDLAKAKNWKQIHITGTESFKARAYIEAVRAGLAIVGYEPSAELRAQLNKEKTMTDQAGAGGMMALTPDVVANAGQASPADRWLDPLRLARERLEADFKAAKEKLAGQLDARERERLSGMLIPLRFAVGEIQYMESEIKKGHDPEPAFSKAWQYRKQYPLKPWQQMALAPVFEADAAREQARQQADAAASAHVNQMLRQEQIQRELAAQQQADAIQEQMGKPGLSEEQEEALEQQHRYFLSLADGLDEEEAKERASKKSNAPRPS